MRTPDARKQPPLLRGLGPFSIVVADPPWSFSDALGARGAGANYDLLDQAAIESFASDVELQLTPDALLFLWRVSSQPAEAIATARAWGFEPKTELVWIKTTTNGLAFGMGRYVRAAHETCIIAARGRGTSLIESRSVRSVFFADRRTHSEKPEEFYQLLDQLVTPGLRKVEFFARRTRPGWTQIGNEISE